MRITHGVMVTSFLGDMNTNLNNMSKLQKQLDTGKLFSKPSDDPFRVARSMQMYTEVNANKQYNKNIDDATNWMDTTDTALSQGTSCLQRIRELMVSAGNAAYGSNELTAIKDEINEKVAEFGQILNTSFDGKYIFGGKDGASKPVKVEEIKMTSGNLDLGISNADKYKGQTPGTIKVENLDKINNTVKINGVDKVLDGNKITVDGVDLDFSKVADGSSFDISVASKKNSISVSGSEANIDQSLKIEISSGVTVDYNVNALEVLNFKTKDKDGNVVNVDVSKVLDDIINNLSSVDSKDKVVGENLGQIDQIINNMLSLNSKVGAMQNRMESAKDLNVAQNENLTEILSANEDIDFVEKSMEMGVAQTVYMAALQTSAKILQPSILDFLR
ncbi:MAG: flagellar hook-associated protein FlgL [Clostridium sp.]|uniref:flagellar hook-associated protein FlgL n=1 Tax=Clostridium sp. TaxID=1506 RepID=UPI00307457EE